jgi:enterochelin esterase family protein
VKPCRPLAARWLGRRVQKTLLEDIIPMIDANFRTLADQPHRAMAGLSMGGMQTRAITLANPEVFSLWACSAAEATAWRMSIMPRLQGKSQIPVRQLRKPRTRKPQARLRRRPAGQYRSLKKAGMNTHFYVSPLTAHEWQSWRRSLYEFAQRIFK